MIKIEQISQTSEKTGYWGVKFGKPAMVAAFVVRGEAAAKRGHRGKVVVGVEWYTPESLSDDDASTSGRLLPLRSGNARVSREVVLSADENITESIGRLAAAGVSRHVLSILEMSVA